jgi:hypothetical protein
VLDAGAAARLGLKPQGSPSPSASGAAPTAGYLHGLDVVAPGVTVVGVPFTVRSLEPLAVHFGRRIDGILGYDFLLWFAADFNFAAPALRLTEALPKSSAGRTCVPLTFVGRLPYVSVTVVGEPGAERTGTFLVDSGAPVTLQLEGAYATAPALLTGTARRRADSHEVGGASEVVALPVAAVRLGAFELKEPQIMLRESPRADHADGLLGAAILGRFTVRFIYATHRMCLTPNRQAGEAFASDLAGFIPVWPEPDFKPLTVESVSPGSPAARGRPAAGRCHRVARRAPGRGPHGGPAGAPAAPAGGALRGPGAARG